jgi:hypothetical protein
MQVFSDLQYTEKYASKSLQNLITATEFKHSWGQNSIVSLFFPSVGLVILTVLSDRQNQWFFHHRR